MLILKRSRYSLLYFILSIITLLSCADETYEEKLSQAELCFDDALYEDAYSLLDNIDGKSFKPGGYQQARYALLYTKALYKNYIVSPSDSLVSLAVDYFDKHGSQKERFLAYLFQGIVRYELEDYSNSSVSLIRALANSENIDDHYAMGQMFTYLAMVNGVLQCSDEDYYAQKAYYEYSTGGLVSYANSVMETKAIAKIHLSDYDSARYWIDTCIYAATQNSNLFALKYAKSLKAKYAILVDSLSLAQQIYADLSEDSSYVWTSIDYENMAYLYAVSKNEQRAYECLELARAMINPNDQIGYWVQSVEIARKLSDCSEIIKCQDSLLYYQDKMLGEALDHASIASQRDYVEWQLMLSVSHNRQKKYLLIGLCVCLLFLSLSFSLYRRKKTLQVRLQSEIIQKCQLQIKQHEKDVADGLQIIKSSEIVSNINEMITTSTPHIEWDKLYSLYCEKLPLFEKTLRELTNLTETEWRVCMLLKLGFLPGQIAILMNKSPEGISSVRRRLFFKAFSKKGKASEWDDFIISL